MSTASAVELAELRASVRAVVDAASTRARGAGGRTAEPAHDARLWATLAVELGVTGLCVPDRFGGVGAGFTELLVVAEELGRGLASSPLLGSAVLATGALLASADDAACADYLPALVDGSSSATLAFDDVASARQGCDGNGATQWLLSGTPARVVDGTTARIILVPARAGSDVRLFAVDTRSGELTGLTRRPLPTLDPTRPLADLVLVDVPARAIGAAGSGAQIVDRLRDLGAIALAAEQTGGARRCLDMSLDYARTRTQFGRPIGSFQAIKHSCAQLAVEIEAARAGVEYAGRAVDAAAEETPEVACVVAAHCTETFDRAAALNIQIHGAIGFTWEHDAHRYLKRARADRYLFGTPSSHRARLLDRLDVQ